MGRFVESPDAAVGDAVVDGAESGGAAALAFAVASTSLNPNETLSSQSQSRPTRDLRPREKGVGWDRVGVGVKEAQITVTQPPHRLFPSPYPCPS